MKERELKQFLYAKIEEIISTLELRINLNTQTIVSHDLLNKRYAPLSIQLNEYQNNKAENVIKSCNDNIKKLVLLKSCIEEVETQKLISIFHNYNHLSFDTIYRELYSFAMVS